VSASARSTWTPSFDWKPSVATQDRPTPTAEVTAAIRASTIALAHSAGRRVGTAAKVDRIIPVEYSEVIASTPSTASVSWATPYPMVTMKTARAEPVPTTASGPAPAGALDVPQLSRVLNPTMSATVRARVQTVERTVRVLIHSELSTRGKVTPIRDGRASATGCAVMTGAFRTMRSPSPERYPAGPLAVARPAQRSGTRRPPL